MDGWEGGMDVADPTVLSTVRDLVEYKMSGAILAAKCVSIEIKAT